MSYSAGVSIGPHSDYSFDLAVRIKLDYGLICFTVSGPTWIATAVNRATGQSWSRSAATEDEAMTDLAGLIDEIFRGTPPPRR